MLVDFETVPGNTAEPCLDGGVFGLDGLAILQEVERRERARKTIGTALSSQWMIYFVFCAAGLSPF